MVLTSQRQESLSTFLQGIAESLDIPDHIYDDAVAKYEDVGDWLGAEDSELQSYSPTIYSQGSFRLGTVVRPLNSKGRYDIDLVCHLNIAKESTTQSDLKKLIGARLRKRDDLKGSLSESGRCWVLEWTDRFHMDVLPAIPNEERRPNGILLTDKDLVRWQKSNPIRYAEWFYGQMRVILNERRASLAKSLEANIEDVPDWQAKTPLQRAIQILKRHRDLYFSADSSFRPASIILTTLAAHSYANQADLFDALAGIVEGMPKHIELVNGKYFVKNPADPDENFAEKWNDDSKRRDAFVGWLHKVKSDFDVWMSQSNDLRKSYRLFENSFGTETIGSALAFTEQRLQKSESAIVPGQSLVPQLGNTSHARNPTWPVNPTYRASLKGTVHLAGRKKRLWDLTNRPVNKGLSLKFELETNAPKPFDVYWQVVNTGTEAAAEPNGNGLRGQIQKFEANDSTHWEETKYRGTHWVEAFVVKDGRCVARTGKKLVRIR